MFFVGKDQMLFWTSFNWFKLYSWRDTVPQGTITLKLSFHKQLSLKNMSLSPLQGLLNWVLTKKLVSPTKGCFIDLQLNPNPELVTCAHVASDVVFQSSSAQWAAPPAVPGLEPGTWQSLHEGRDGAFWAHRPNTCAERASDKRSLDSHLTDFTPLSLTHSSFLQSHHELLAPATNLTHLACWTFHWIHLDLLKQHRALHTKFTRVHSDSNTTPNCLQNQVPVSWLLRKDLPEPPGARLSGSTTLLLLTLATAVSGNYHVPRTPISAQM